MGQSQPKQLSTSGLKRQPTPIVLTSDKERKIMALFDQYDKNHNGVLELDEFLRFAEYWWGELTLNHSSDSNYPSFEDFRREIFDVMDKDQNNKISFQEFLDYMKNSPDFQILYEESISSVPQTNEIRAVPMTASAVVGDDGEIRAQPREMNAVEEAEFWKGKCPMTMGGSCRFEDGKCRMCGKVSA